MRRLRTTASRWAAVACLAIALIYLVRVAEAPSAAYLLGEIVMGVLGVAAAVKMWLHNCFESHLAAGALVAATAGGTLLAVTAGLPGGGASGLTPTRVVLLALSATVVVLLVQDGRVRREHARRARRPYAR